MRVTALSRAVAKPGGIQARRKHFLTLPPSVPARPHPQPASAEASAPLSYGWGDWFLASVVSSFVAWPFVAATDALWGEVLLPLVADNADASTAVAAASIFPKATASYFGARLYGAGSSHRMQALSGALRGPRASCRRSLTDCVAFRVSLTGSAARVVVLEALSAAGAAPQLNADPGDPHALE